jgi:hypothetical protein
MLRWVVFFAVPIVLVSLLFQADLTSREDFLYSFFGPGRAYGAPFSVGVTFSPPAIGETATPGRFSIEWFALNVLITAAIMAAAALIFQTRNAWLPSLAAVALMMLVIQQAGSGVRIANASIGLSYWIAGLVAFAASAAVVTGIRIFRREWRRA